MKHPRLAYFLFVWWIGAVAAVAPRAARAMALTKEVAGYDVHSLGLAALIALLGGAFRTIYVLANDDTPVWNTLRQSWRDAAIALMAGGIVYLIFELLRAGAGINLVFEIRFPLLICAGVARVQFFKWATSLGGQIADIVADWAVARARGFFPTTPVDEPPKGTP